MTKLSAEIRAFDLGQPMFLISLWEIIRNVQNGNERKLEQWKHLPPPLVSSDVTQRRTQYTSTCGRKEEQHVTGVLKASFLPL